MNNLQIFQAQRHGQLPVGAGSVAGSKDPEALLYAIEHGNRATRRVAKRNLIKQMEKPLGAVAFQRNKG